ncbi:MAG TPA: hypothetical protein VMY69_05210 [Phycisphaerae bacterium]|nr:hypothetical protein [Phycisphaerae bacterium]
MVDPIAAVRSALADPPADGLAAPVLARDLGELRRRLARARLRGGRYVAVDFSPHVRDLVMRLDAGAAVPGAEKVH